MTRYIDNFTIEGFKSIEHLVGMRLDSLNVLIGANGSGKSNLVSFFKLLGELANGRFQAYVAKNPPVDGYFFNGVSETKTIRCTLVFPEGRYFLRLESPTDEKMQIASERVTPRDDTKILNILSWKSESGLPGHASNSVDDNTMNQIARSIYETLSQIQVYHFHDTSGYAGMRRKCGIAQHVVLASDASNLAPFLYRLQKSCSKAYDLIESTLRRVAPYLDALDFDIQSGGAEDQVRLLWTQKEINYRFTAGHLSDGTIRFLSLAVALLQPNPPRVVVLDEPELGLHPEAISVLGGLIRSASTRMQLIVATQSPALLSEFDACHVITVDQRNGCSQFKRLKTELLKEWLQDYSLGELWQKGIIHGEVQNTATGGTDA